MKKVFDTNPILNACIFESYQIKVINYTQSSDSLTVLTVYNEIQDKLLLLNNAFLILAKFD